MMEMGRRAGTANLRPSHHDGSHFSEPHGQTALFCDGQPNPKVGWHNRAVS